MKHFRFLAAAFALVAVASCDGLPGTGNENEDNNGDGGNTVVNTLPYVEPQDRIVARQYGEDGPIEYFEYNSTGQLSRMTTYRDRAYDGSSDDAVSIITTDYSYEGLLFKENKSVVIIYKPSDEASEYLKKDDISNSRRAEGVLNASGRFVGLTDYRYEHDYWNDEYTEYISGVTAYTYDAYGNLLGVVERYDSGDGGELDYEDSYVYAWENGNPKYIDYGEGEKYNFSFREEEYVWPGVNIYYDLDATDFYGDVHITGLDGRKWANLLDKVYAINSETNEESYMKMVYTFDAKGRVKTINSYFAEGDDVGEMDDSDAVTFYYGDEALPEPPVSVPVYLVKQEYVSHQMGLHKLNDGSGYVAEAGSFDINIKIRNVFSDGSTMEYTQVNFGNVYVEGNGHLESRDITREELNELRSYSGANLSVLHGQNEFGENSLMAVCNYPVIGDIELPVVLRGNNEIYIDPQEYVIYDQSEGGMVTRKLDIFTPEYLRSIMRVRWTLSKVETFTDESWEQWIWEQTITLNLWPDLQIPDASSSVYIDMYVPKE